MSKKKKNRLTTTKLQRYVTVIDDWYPNYPEDKVRLFIAKYEYSLPLKGQCNFVRVAVWGNDDFGLEQDFIGTDDDLDRVFNDVKESYYDVIPDGCNQQYFRGLGFTNA